MEIGHRKERLVEGSNQEKIYQKAQIKNVGQCLDGQRDHSLAPMQSFFQHNSGRLLLDPREWEKNQRLEL